MFKKAKNKKGFTLIELIVVIAILAVLAAIIIPTVASSLDRANEARDLANVRSAYAEFAVELLTAEDPATVTAPVVPGASGATVTCTFSNTGTSITAFQCVMPTGTYSLQTNGQISKNAAPAE